MTFEDLERQIVSVKDDDEGEVGSGASEETIADAERLLGCRIGGGYRLFLLRFGWARLFSLEVYGLGADAPDYLDLIRITLSERTEMHPTLPPALLPLLNDGAGNLFCLDTANSNEGESQVVLWVHDRAADQTPVKVGGAFVDWLSKEIVEESAR